MYKGLIRIAILAGTIAFAGGFALGLTQLHAGHPTVFVTVQESPAIKVRPGARAVAPVRFRIADGLHVNSNQPDSDLLIPTSLKLTPPPGILVGKMVYPKGESFALEFAPAERLSVYSGEVVVKVPVTVSRKMKKGSYEITGELSYQACDNHSCYPPKTAAVKVPVEVR